MGCRTYGGFCFSFVCRKVWTDHSLQRLGEAYSHHSLVFTMSFLSEFKEFVSRGNVIDLATGVVIGAAFGKITSSMVDDLIMPPIGVLLGKVNFKDLKFVLQEAVGESKAVTINYGNFIQTLIDFLIIAFVIFMVIKGYNRLLRKQAEAAPAPAPAPPSNEEVLLTQIRDLLKGSSDPRPRQ